MRLAAVEPLPIMIGPARAASEGVSCDIVRADVLDLLRDVLRAAIADVRGPERVLEGPMKTPHLSVAYATAAGSARSVDTTLNNEDVTAVVMVRTIQLVRSMPTLGRISGRLREHSTRVEGDMASPLSL